MAVFSFLGFGETSTRSPEDEEQFRLQQGLAELEFRSGINKEMDAVAALGYEPGKGKATFTPLGDAGGGLAGVYTPPVGRFKEGDKLPSGDPIQQQTEQDIRIGDVVVSRDFISSERTWAHEFRHRGLNELRTRFSREDFSAKYGDDVAKFLYDEGGEEDVVRFMSGPIEGAENTTGVTQDRGGTLTKALTQAALDVMEDDRSQPEVKKEAVGWLRSLFQGRDE